MEKKFDVLDFLLNNPHFLIEHSSKLGISFDSKKIKSMAEVQILSSKNKLDKISLHYQEILVNIKRNEIILNKLEKLYFNLMECQKLSKVIKIIENSLNKDFLLPIFSIKLAVNKERNIKNSLIKEDNILNVDSQDLNDLKKIVSPFGDTKCVIDSLYSWLPKKINFESFLHIPLNYKNKFLGFILIAHTDYRHFSKDISTDFISSMAKAISITVYRIINTI